MALHYAKISRSASAHDEKSLATALVIVCWTFALAAIVVVGVRCYVRLRILKRFLSDDWVILVTLILCLTNSALCTASVHFGLGQHAHLLSPKNFLFATKYIFIAMSVAMFSSCIGRIAYVLLLLQILPPSVWQRRFLYVVAGTQFVIPIMMVSVNFSQCNPVSAYWEGGMVDGSGRCWSPKVQERVAFFQGSVCSLVDFILAVFPAVLFARLNMKWSTKVYLSALMGLGVFALVCSIVKTNKLGDLTESEDPTYHTADVAMWWTLETYVVLLAAAIPTLGPLARTLILERSRPSAKNMKEGRYKIHDVEDVFKTRMAMTHRGDRQLFRLGRTIGVNDRDDASDEVSLGPSVATDEDVGRAASVGVVSGEWEKARVVEVIAANKSIVKTTDVVIKSEVSETRQ